MKILLKISIFLCITQFTIACPNCNIHNYLFGSLNASSTIYHGKVVKILSNGNAEVEILEIFKNAGDSTVLVGKKKVEYLGSLLNKMDAEYIFSNPMFYTVSFEILKMDYEWEVKYLINTTRKVQSTFEALRLLECVSTKSNQDGRKYIESNFESCYDSLIQRISSFRKECQESKTDFYNTHRLNNLIRALFIQEDKRTIEFLREEINSIKLYDFQPLQIEILKYTGSISIGEYLRIIIDECQNFDFYNEILTEYISYLSDVNMKNSGYYFSYALCFKQFESLNSITITDKNRQIIVYGMLQAALWFNYFFQKDKQNEIIQGIEKINLDDNIDTFISKRFSKK